MNQYKKFIAVGIGMLSLGHVALASEHGVGNGGDAYFRNGHYYSLDLVEAGEENAPYFNENINIDEPSRQLMKQKFSEFGIEVPFAMKMAEIKNLNPALYEIFFALTKAFDYSLVIGNLKDIKDANSNIDLNHLNLSQAAVRTGYRIQFSRDTTSKMNLKNRTALFFHELSFSIEAPDLAYTVPNAIINSCDDVSYDKSGFLFINNSDSARTFVGKLFDRKIMTGDRELLADAIGESLAYEEGTPGKKAIVSMMTISISKRVELRELFPALQGCPAGKQIVNTEVDVGNEFPVIQWE